MKMKFLCVLLCLIFSTASYAAQTTFRELESHKINSEIGSKNVISSDHWVYTNLKSISEKYGLLVDMSEDKFSQNKPLTRNEAAVMLVNLSGKIEEDSIDLTESEKTKIEILRSELKKELQQLAGRVEKLEDTVQVLEGRVTQLGDADKNSAKFGFAETLKIMGAIQAQYTGNFGKGVSSSPSNFSLPVVDISLAGKIRPHLNYFINTFPSRNYDSAANGTLGDVWLSTDIVPFTTVYFGQKRKPLGLEGMQSPYTLETASRAQISRNIGDKRDTGITAIGNWKYIDYAAGIYNGSGINSKDTENSDLESAIMATINPLYAIPEYGTFKIGSVYDHGKATTYNHNTFGAIAQYLSNDKKFKLQSEFLKKVGYLADDQKASGWYVHSSYFLTDKFQLLARLDSFDQNLSTAQDIINEYTLGSNYYFHKHNLKLMTDLVYVQNKTGKDSRRVIVKTQYRF